MATTYLHKKSSIGSNNPSNSDLQTGEIAVNLASGKVHTTRVLYSGTFVGEVDSVSGNILTLTAAAATTVAANTTIAARTTDSTGPSFAPNINTSTAVSSSGTSLTVSNVVGRQFTSGDYVWLVSTTDSEQVLEISGHSSTGLYPPLNPNTGDIWVDISDSSDPKIMIFGDSEFDEFVSGSGSTGGSSGFTSDSLEDSDAEDIDFGLITSLGTDRNNALAVTYSAVDYDFGGIRSPRPGPDFGEIV